MTRSANCRILLSFAAVIVIPVSISAEEQDQDVLKLPVVYEVPGMDDVQVKRDLVYRTVDGVELKINVYLPAAPGEGERLPGIVFIHGGPLPATAEPKPIEWGVFESYGRLTAAQGMIGITFNHRLHSWGDLEKSESDIIAAIDFARARTAEFRLNAEKLAVWVFSGGGPLISYFLREKPSYLKAIVSYYAVLDLSESQNITKEIGEDLVTRFSPVRYVGEKEQVIAPIFIARAGKDSPAINRSVETMFRNAMASHLVFELMNHPTGLHGFDILDDDDLSREIIARTFEFIKPRMRIK